MKQILIFTMLILTACANHHPILATAPKDAAKYEQVRQKCVTEARSYVEMRTNQNQAAGLSSGFGAIGGIISLAAGDHTPKDFKSQATLVDECVAARGYKLAN